MRTKIYCLLFLIYSLTTFSQKFSSHPVALTPTVFPTSMFDEETYKNRLYKKFSFEEKTSVLDNYIQEDMFGQKYFFSSNQIYTNWEEATQYVKKVFKKSIPSEYSTNDVKIFIVRDAEPNAYCMEDGNIAVTVGLLSYINNEAELAATLCHEFGHYYSNHLYVDYKKRNKNKYFKAYMQATSILGSLLVMKNHSSFQQNQERQADTFSYNFFF